VSPAPPFLTSPAPRKPRRKARLPHLAPRYWLVRQTRRWRLFAFRGAIGKRRKCTWVVSDRAAEKQSGRKLASAGATTSTQDATLQVSSISPALPQHASKKPVGPQLDMRARLEARQVPAARIDKLVAVDGFREVHDRPDAQLHIGIVAEFGVPGERSCRLHLHNAGGNYGIAITPGCDRPRRLGAGRCEDRRDRQEPGLGAAGGDSQCCLDDRGISRQQR